MDPSDLLDYALGQLDAPGRERLERELANDPTLAGIMARLVRNLARLLDDGRERLTPAVHLGPPAPPNPLEAVEPPRPEASDGGPLSKLR